MLLAVGLGNPGPRYEDNRHNIGFMAIDRIATRLGGPSFRARFQGLIAEAKVAGTRVLLLKPMTYMNESGRAVGEAMRFYKIEPTEVVVFHDEIDLAAGKVRVKTGGGAAGHNGIRSIDQHIGPAYRRVRIGVGHPGEKERVHGHVLSDFAAADRPWLDRLLDALADAFPLVVEGRDELYMTRVAELSREPTRKAPAAKRREETDTSPKPPSPAVAAEPAPGTMGAALKRALGRLRRPKSDE